MRTFFRSVVVALLAFPLIALGQEPMPSPTFSGLPILDVITGHIGNAPAIIFTVAGMALALAMRLFKTERPAGILFLVIGLLRKGVVILAQLVNLLTKLAEALEKVNPVPQNAEKPAPVLEVKSQ
jgi:hypothetical protein